MRACRIRESSLFFSEQQFPPESTSNEHGCCIAPSQLNRRHCFAHHARRMHPSYSPPPLPQPIHHTQNASRWPSSSPGGRRKIDLFVYRGKERVAGARRSKRKGKDRGESRGRLIPRCVCVCTKDSHHQSVRKMSYRPQNLYVMDSRPQMMYLLSCSVHSPVSACAVYLSYSAYLISAQCV